MVSGVAEDELVLLELVVVAGVELALDVVAGDELVAVDPLELVVIGLELVVEELVVVVRLVVLAFAERTGSCPDTSW
ncbi:MAG TPA: hypothetical protein VKT31_01830 [Solirubrobacteraceae bacterium]|nr:hypothetical protein [Solirubrobacteraceae bacterium]